MADTAGGGVRSRQGKGTARSRRGEKGETAESQEEERVKDYVWGGAGHGRAHCPSDFPWRDITHVGDIWIMSSSEVTS